MRALLEVAPARSDEVRAAARAALDAGQPELALRLLSAFARRGIATARCASRPRLAAGDRSRAEGVLASWMPRGPGELLEVARGYLAIGMADRAVELARVALSAEAGAEARLVLGRALRVGGRLGEAAEVLAAIDPASGAWPEGPIELALVLRDAGRPALAAEVLSRAESRRAESGIALALAEARREAGDAGGRARGPLGRGSARSAPRERACSRAWGAWTRPRASSPRCRGATRAHGGAEGARARRGARPRAARRGRCAPSRASSSARPRTCWRGRATRSSCSSRTAPARRARWPARPCRSRSTRRSARA
ncbi:MAG: hypothetical protein M5U28_00680 [Sandaracinaceae bacterium]|nr:hypothetical protein [Sandaracinaceae bacterium]